MLKEITIPNFKNSAGTVQDIRFTYQVAGRDLGEAPIVMVFHALSGNSDVAGSKGWWQDMVGVEKPVDLRDYTILAFDMPGNGFDGKPSNLLNNYNEFTLGDIARIYAEALDKLHITDLFAGIGGSIGGALIWELAVIRPQLFQHIIPVATDYKATQWVRALCKVQEQILNNSAEPLKDARMHAMTFYRSPKSLQVKFESQLNSAKGNVENWLEYHGKKLQDRFQLASYKLMNHLLTTIDVSKGSGDHLSAAAKIKSDIHIVTVDSDRFFLPEENWETYVNLSLVKSNISIYEIRSIHGHDAFLIEYIQLGEFIKPVFKQNNLQYKKDKHSTLSDK